MTKQTRKQRTFTRSSFAEHNYNYVKKSQTSEPPRTNPQNHLFLQRQNFQQPTLYLINFNDNPRIPKDPSENYPFFQQNKHSKQHNQNKHKTPYYTPNYLSSDDDNFYDQNHQQNFQNQRLHSYHVNQPDIFEPYQDSLDKITHLKMIIFIHKTQLKQTIINQHKCKMKYYYHIVYNNMK